MSGGRFGSVSAVAAIAAVAVATGCGGDAFTSTSAQPDSATPVAEAGLPDAGPDDDVRVDAGRDAALAVDAGAGWCATQSSHTFCEDFLHGVPDKLTPAPLVNAVLVAESDAVSPPQSMAAITQKLPAKGESATALATEAFPLATGTDFTLASYFKIASSCFPANGQVDAVSIVALLFTEDNYEVAIDIAPSAVALVEIATADGGVSGSPMVQTFATGNLFDTWQLWTLTVSGGIPKTVSLTVGSTTVIPAKTALKGAQTILLQHPTIALGASVKNDQALSPGCKVNVDDIVFDVKAVATPGN
jgi:hypothetical protein